MPQLSFKPVTKNDWDTFSSFFESKGAPHYCWCTAWRRVEGKKPSKQDKKESIKGLICKGTPVGILAYDHGDPVAWCSVGPRNSFKPLGGDDTLEKVWSITCFFVKRQYRGKGITKLLLKQAIEYAKKSGAAYVEAYPVEKDSPTYQFMGSVPVFEKAGFKFKKKAGKRRNVMLFEC